VVFVSRRKLWTFSKFWKSPKHGCGECNWITTKNNKGKGSIEEWAHMEARGGSGIVEKNKNKWGVEKSKTWRCVEYSTIGYRGCHHIHHHLQNVQKGRHIMRRYNLHKW
jgi:hypothetical protein